jgi:hypothetical protein
MGYGAHFLTTATTFTPFYAAISAYNTNGSQVQSATFLATFGTLFPLPLFDVRVKTSD